MNDQGTKPKTEEDSDPMVHAAYIKQMLADTADHTREGIEKIDDPRAKALFETTAEVLQGLQNAYQHYQNRSEKAWK